MPVSPEDRIAATVAELYRHAETQLAALMARHLAGDLDGEMQSPEWAAWAQSAQGQEQIAAAFSLLAQVSAHLAGVLPLVVSVLGTVASAFAALPAPAQSVVAALLAWITVVGMVSSRLGPLIGGLATLGGKFLTAGTLTSAQTHRQAAQNDVYCLDVEQLGLLDGRSWR